MAKKTHFKHLRSMDCRQKVQAELVLSFRPDIIAIQEYNPINCEIIDSILKENGFLVIKQDREHFHINAIAIREQRLAVVWDQQKKSRALIAALRDLETGRVFIVVNVHLDSLDTEARINQLLSYHKVSDEYVHGQIKVYCESCNRNITHANLAEHNKSNKHLANGGDPLFSEQKVIPIIWLGDFNLTPASPEWFFMTDTLKLRQAYHDMNLQKFATHWSGRMIDHVFYQPLTFRPVNAIDTRHYGFTNDGNPSDHLPVVVDFQFVPPAIG